MTDRRTLPYSLTGFRNIWEKNWPEMHAAATGGLPGFVFARRPRDLDDSVPVFYYHDVEADEFEDDLKFLKINGYVTIDCDSMLWHLKGECPAPQRSVILTFDDGSRSLYDDAYPLLQKYGMKAVAFIATRFHEEKFDHTLSSSKKHLSYPLSWSQIREMHKSGIIDFQSHTHEHRYIPRWPEPADLEGSDAKVIDSLRDPRISIAEDFKLSKDALEQNLNKTVRHLAFPRFYGTEVAMRIGQSLGFEAFWWGVLPLRPCNGPGQSSLYIVRIGGRYLRRLPGHKREPLHKIMQKRYGNSIFRLLGHARSFFAHDPIMRPS
jgi:peptidoglycan/xylan/chitin deacetylase (PgdA/CDA1 family)